MQKSKTTNLFIQSVIHLAGLKLETIAENKSLNSVKDSKQLAENMYFLSKLKIQRVKLIKQINKSLLYLN